MNPPPVNNQRNVDWPQIWAHKTVERVKLKGFSPNTGENYSNAVKKFTKHFSKHPQHIQDHKIRSYLKHLDSNNQYAPATFNLHIDGLRFFYKEVIGRPIDKKILEKKKLPQSLPEVFSQEELKKLFEAIPNQKHRLILKAGYAFGLRVNRTVALKLSDFDFSRNLLFVKGDKGKKDRYVMLSQDFLQDLDEYLKTNSIENDLFPSYRTGKTITARFANKVIQEALQKSGIKKKATYHTLRHSFGTHLHEAGYSLRDIQVLMGHSSSRTTERYTKVSSRHITGIVSPLDEMMNKAANPKQNKVPTAYNFSIQGEPKKIV